MTAYAISLDWLPRFWQRPDPPTSDPLVQLRQELLGALSVERQERQHLADLLEAQREAHGKTYNELVATREELKRSRDYGKEQANTIALLRSTVETLQKNAANLTTELSGLIGSNGALQEAQRRLEADHKTDQETIALLRERLHTMEEELKTLRDERQQHIGTIAGLRMAVDSLKRELDKAHEQLKQRADEGGAG